MTSKGPAARRGRWRPPGRRWATRPEPKGFGLNRVRVEPGRLSTPPHSHGRSEEIYFVLGGSGLLWQDEAVSEVRAGDTIVQVADHFEHTFKGGPDGLEYLVFGTRHPVEYGWLPRSRAIRLGWPWVEGRTDNPWDVEAEVGEPEFAEPGERPPNVVAVEEIQLDEDGDKGLAAAAGSVRADSTGSGASRAGADAPRTATRRVRGVRRARRRRDARALALAARADDGAEYEEQELRAGQVVAGRRGRVSAHSIVAGEEASRTSPTERGS